MKCAEFQNEFEEQNALSEAAETHLFHCKDCQSFESDQNRVWEMLGGLGQVEAPKDFNFRVKARIAEARSSGGFVEETSFFPALRFVLPLGFVIVLLSFVALSGLYFVGTQGEQPIATQTTPSPEEKKVVQTEIGESNKSEIFPEEKQMAEVVENDSAEEIPAVKQNSEPKNQKPDNLVAEKKDKTSKKPVEKPNNEGGSRDLAGTKPPTIIQPEFDVKQIQKQKPNRDSSKTINIKDVLEISGIETVLKGGKYSVKSVRKNSIAEQNQIKTGDLIVAINGKKIDGETLGEKAIELTSITVLRGDKSLVIKLKTN